MIGQLPKKLEVNGIPRTIRSDYRVALLIFQAFADIEMPESDKAVTMLECLYEDYKLLLPEEYQEAVEKAAWFLDGGKEHEDPKDNRKLMDWEQDEGIIFSAINKVAGCETRAMEYMHWWTFLGFYYEIGESLFSTVIGIRDKKSKGKKLEKHEQEFYRDNKQLIDLNTKYSPEELEEMERLNQLLG